MRYQTIYWPPRWNKFSWLFNFFRNPSVFHICLPAQVISFFLSSSFSFDMSAVFGRRLQLWLRTREDFGVHMVVDSNGRSMKSVCRHSLEHDPFDSKDCLNFPVRGVYKCCRDISTWCVFHWPHTNAIVVLRTWANFLRGLNMRSCFYIWDGFTRAKLPVALFLRYTLYYFRSLMMVAPCCRPVTHTSVESAPPVRRHRR